MAKAKPKAATPSDVRLSWPATPKEISPTPRLYRIHRMNAFEWQAYVTVGSVECAIGKPDLFDILKNKVAGCMRLEGQLEFMEAKSKGVATSVQ